MSKPKTKHFVIIQWGEMQDRESQEHYTFDSEAELKAFILGMDAAHGRSRGYEVIRTGAYDE